MAELELVLPAMGEGIIEATITKWLVKEGGSVEEDQPLLEIATDKVDSEIPSPVTGIISKIIKAEDEVAAVGDIIAILETKALPEDPDNKGLQGEAARIKGKDRHKENESSQAGTDLRSTSDLSSPVKNKHNFPRQTISGNFITPLVRRIAEEENIPPEELERIEGSGENGRICKSDILQHLKSKSEKRSENTVQEQTAGDNFEEKPVTTSFSAVDPGGITADVKGTFPGEGESEKESAVTGDGNRVIKMDRIRKLIADHMVNSKQTSAHVTSFIDTDVTELVKWLQINKIDFQKREHQKLTYTPFFIMAVAKALRDHPMINISVTETNIIVKKDVNIGMAVAITNGNLIVPVIKNADEKNLIGMVKTVNDLADRARKNKLQAHETRGGTFTITNFGTFKNTAGTPIINQPEAAILGTGAIIKKPVVIETNQGDVIGIRHMMTLSLSYDHRVIDGALGGIFLARISEYLENFNPGQII